MRRVAGKLLAACSVSLAAAPVVARAPTADAAGLTKRMGLKTGHWSTRITIDALDVVPLDAAKPLPPEAAAKIAEARGKTQMTDDCLGDKPPIDGALILPGISIGADCRFERIDTANGRLQLAANCGDGTGTSTIDTIDEGFTPDHMAGTVSVKATGGGMAVTIAMTLDAHYVGPACPLKPS